MGRWSQCEYLQNPSSSQHTWFRLDTDPGHPHKILIILLARTSYTLRGTRRAVGKHDGELKNCE